MKKRFNLLPTYHFEENTDGKIRGAADCVLRDCTVYGNCGKNLFNWNAINKSQDWYYLVNGTTVSVLDNGAVMTGNSKNLTRASSYENGWFRPGNTYEGDVTLAAGDIVTVSANIKAVTISENFSDNNWCHIYLYGIASITPSVQHQFPADGTVQRISQTFNIAKSGSYYPVFTMNSNTLEITDIQIAVNNSDITYEPYKTVGDLDAKSGKYVLPVTVSGKNLIPYPYTNTTLTSNGITFTDNGDGTVTANGTATANAWFFIKYDSTKLFDVTKTYTLSGGFDENSFVYAGFYKNGKWVAEKGTYNQAGTVKIDLSSVTAEYDTISLRACVRTGTTVDNVIFRPQLELGEAATEFEPYTTPKTTNLLLDAPLGPGESISCREEGLLIPELATLDPSITNHVTFGSEVKPSGVTCEYYKY